MFTPVCNCCSHSNTPLCLNCVYGDGGLMNHFEAAANPRGPKRNAAPKAAPKSRNPRRKPRKAA